MEQNALVWFISDELSGAPAQIPPQLLCPHEREAQRFDSSNALVSDPMAALEAEERERPWATEEKRIFNEKFLAFPKACYNATLGSRQTWKG